MYQLLTAAILSFLIAFTHLTSSFALVNQIQNPLDDAHGLIHSVNSTGTAVPGSSPVRYGRDPLHNLFTISQLDMHPNPCVMFVPCTPPSTPSSANIVRRTQQRVLLLHHCSRKFHRRCRLRPPVFQGGDALRRRARGLDVWGRQLLQMGGGGPERDKAVSAGEGSCEVAVDGHAGWGLDSGGELMASVQVFSSGGADEYDAFRRTILLRCLLQRLRGRRCRICGLSLRCGIRRDTDLQG